MTHSQLLPFNAKSGSTNVCRYKPSLLTAVPLMGMRREGEEHSDMSLHTGIPGPSTDQAEKYGRLRVWSACKSQSRLAGLVFAEDSGRGLVAATIWCGIVKETGSILDAMHAGSLYRVHSRAQTACRVSVVRSRVRPPVRPTVRLSFVWFLTLLSV